MTDKIIMRALVVDDELLARQRLISMLADVRDVQIVGEASSGSHAVQAIASLRPDLIFLDVQMPGLDGFGVLRCTTGAHRPLVIFVTAFDEFAIRAFDVNAADYLLKPVTAARLIEAVRRAAQRMHGPRREADAEKLNELLRSVEQEQFSGERFAIRVDHETLLLNVADIRWVEAQGDVARVHVKGIAHVTRETLAELGARLEPFEFVRVHRSAIVNPKAVRAVRSASKGDYELTLVDGTIVRSGRSFRSVVQGLIRS